MLDIPPLAAEPRQILDGLSAVALEESAALEELVHGLMPLRLLSRRLLSSETFRIIAAAVPGILEAALLARVVGWLEERDRRGRARYDVVVLDSPASGHSVPLLATPRTLSGLATVGPLGAVMRRTSRWLSDPALTRALVVAIPEDWAIAEAVELYESLRDGLDIPVGRPVLNAVFPRRFTRGDEALLQQAEASHTVDPHLLEAGRYFLRAAQRGGTARPGAAQRHRRAAARAALRVLDQHDVGGPGPARRRARPRAGAGMTPSGRPGRPGRRCAAWSSASGPAASARPPPRRRSRSRQRSAASASRC